MTILNDTLGQNSGPTALGDTPLETIMVPPGQSVGSEVRLTFTSAEVGNGADNDSNTMANQDGGLAVRVQGEDGSGELTGDVTRFGDEGVRFASTDSTLRFDVRDLVSGVARGNMFSVVELGTSLADTLDHSDSGRAYYVNGGQGNDTVRGGIANDFLVGGAGSDALAGGTGNDSFIGGGGDDVIYGSFGTDTAIFNVLTDGSDRVNLGTGQDVVNVAGAGVTNVRLTFTSAEIGNGLANDRGTLANQDGALAVRVQAEDAAGELTGAVSRYDDEGMTFVSTTPGLTFDVRDLVSGVGRGDTFEIAQLGTIDANFVGRTGETRAAYINTGQGNDTVRAGMGDDFIVGGSGADALGGAEGNDSFIGGGGNDVIYGSFGNDTAIFNVLTDGADQVDMGTGADVVSVGGAGVTNVRLTFTSSEVGNALADDRGTLANQDGGLAVRLQGEDASGELTGAVSRFDDEGVTFVSSAPGLTFDVRDLVSGVGRGASFDAVQLGTSAAETLDRSAEVRNYYINAGQGNDTLRGGFGNDFLVGGSGADALAGAQGNDSFIGGGGSDVIYGSFGDDTAILNVLTDGSDRVDLGTGADVVNVAGAGVQNVRLTFTSAEVGNALANDRGTLANQDGALAVRMQGEDASGELSGAVSRFDDEGVTFVSTTAGLTFDVRDLVSGVARGAAFEMVQLGTSAADAIDRSAETRAIYVNVGQGNDSVTTGAGQDFLVGGSGNDSLNGGEGNDSFIGGGGADTFIFGARSGDDVITGFVSGSDVIDLSALGITRDDVTVTAVGSDTVISGDSNGNGDVDFTITLAATMAFADTDFVF